MIFSLKSWASFETKFGEIGPTVTKSPDLLSLHASLKVSTVNKKKGTSSARHDGATLYGHKNLSISELWRMLFIACVTISAEKCANSKIKML